MFAAFGPIIMAIVYVFLNANGVVTEISVPKMITEILSSTVMAFIAAGISAVYQCERLHYAIAGLIQGSVLLLDYLGIYLFNGWLPATWQTITLFIAIFLAGFVLIWLIVYCAVRSKIKKINQNLQQNAPKS